MSAVQYLELVFLGGGFFLGYLAASLRYRKDW